MGELEFLDKLDLVETFIKDKGFIIDICGWRPSLTSDGVHCYQAHCVGDFIVKWVPNTGEVLVDETHMKFVY